MASSSSSSVIASGSQSGWKYDVFLSFRGEDTRDNFVSHLYTALDQKGIHTFIDNEELEGGKKISLQLPKAIRESRFSIVVLSKTYASSRWCLDELVEILECSSSSSNTTTVYPIFYHVDPSEVRNQTGSFGEEFAKSVSKQRVLGMEEKVQKWRKALEQVGNLSGWHYPSQTIIRSESVFIQEFVKELFKKLTHTDSSVFEDLVGMKSHMEKVIELLGLKMDDARVVGIWGMGGIGKTTIAQAIYACISCQFEGCSFIENVREVSKNSGLKTLREQLISQILKGKDLPIQDERSALTTIQKRVCCKKVLIVLDDVDKSTELEKLIGHLHWFGFGSRIIITTRDQHTLARYGGAAHIYKVEELKEDEAIELFNSKAFEKHQQMEGYKDLVHHAVKYARGVPLALKVLGSFLCGLNKDEWESSLDRLKTSPLEGVQEVLQISYDALHSDEKKIFLDIACFFTGKDKNDVTKILESCKFHPIIGIDVLVKRSLVTILDNKLMMHDLIQELGWNIVRRESPQEPGERSRLWLNEDITDVFTENTGTKKVEGIAMQDFGLKQLELRPEAFENMPKLRILKICHMLLSEDLKFLSNKLSYLDWCGYPMKNMPSTFQPEHLVELHLTYSSIEQLWKGSMQHLNKLWIMNLSHSTYLAKSPDFAKVPNLERLILEGCTGLVNLDPSIGILQKLIVLNLKDCQNLKSLPDNICQLKALRSLNLYGCSKLDKLPQDMGDLDCLEELRADWTAIRQLPSSIGFLKKLIFLNLKDCRNLKSLPDNICQLKALKSLNLSRCSKLDKLPQDMGDLDCLEELRADGTAIRQLPSSIGFLRKLKTLSLEGCKGIASNSWSSFFLPSIFQIQSKNYMTLELEALLRLQSLEKLYLNDCNLKSIPTTICHMYSLRFLYLSGNNFESLPTKMNQLSNLFNLDLRGCKMLQELPKLPSKRIFVKADDCTSLRTIISGPSIFGNNAGYSFLNCFKLEQNILMENIFSTICQSNSTNLCGFVNICVPEVVPEVEIPKWFSHQSKGASSVSFELPPDWYNSRLLGFFVCVIGVNRKSNFCESFCIVVNFKDLGTQTTIISNIGYFRLLFLPNTRSHMLFWYVDREQIQSRMRWYKEEFNEGGIEFQAWLAEGLNFTAKHDVDVQVEKFGVHLLYYKGDEEACCCIESFDLDGSVGVGEEVASASASDSDSDDNYYDAVARPSGSGRFDDQDEDHINNKRTK